MPRVNFRDAALDLGSTKSLLDATRLMDAVPPLNAQVWFGRQAYRGEQRRGRVVDQIWSMSYDNPNEVIVDVILAMETPGR